MGKPFITIVIPEEEKRPKNPGGDVYPFWEFVLNISRHTGGCGKVKSGKLALLDRYAQILRRQLHSAEVAAHAARLAESGMFGMHFPVMFRV